MGIGKWKVGNKEIGKLGELRKLGNKEIGKIGNWGNRVIDKRNSWACPAVRLSAPSPRTCGLSTTILHVKKVIQYFLCALHEL